MTNEARMIGYELLKTGHRREGAFGFMFALGVVVCGREPRNMSELEYEEKDEIQACGPCGAVGTDTRPRLQSRFGRDESYYAGNTRIVGYDADWSC